MPKHFFSPTLRVERGRKVVWFLWKMEPLSCPTATGFPQEEESCRSTPATPEYLEPLNFLQTWSFGEERYFRYFRFSKKLPDRVDGGISADGGGADFSVFSEVTKCDEMRHETCDMWCLTLFHVFQPGDRGRAGGCRGQQFHLLLKCCQVFFLRFISYSLYCYKL